MTNTNQQGQLYRLKKWVDDNYPNFNKSDIESKIDELIVEDGKQGGEEKADKLKFGDYVTIEMNRYGAPNEFYTHKVINRLKSNAWVDVPVVANATEVLHNEMAEVVSCICEGVVETDVFKYRVCDVKKQVRTKSQPSTPVQDGWVRLEDGLPEFNKHVLTYHSTYDNITSNYLDKIVNDKPVWANGVNGISTDVTHWQPLPSSPVNKQD